MNSRKSRWEDSLEDAPVEDQRDETNDALKRFSGRLKSKSEGHGIFANLLRSSDGDADEANDHEIEAETLKSRSEKLAFIRRVFSSRKK